MPMHRSLREAQGTVAGLRGYMPSRTADQTGSGAGKESATFSQVRLFTIWRYGVDREYELRGPATRNWAAAPAVPTTAEPSTTGCGPGGNPGNCTRTLRPGHLP